MKELSVEEKAKRYDNMFERLKEMYNNNKTNVVARLICERYFPELKESEDERIRKKLVQFFKEKDEEDFEEWVPKAKVLAWLEKQGEQKTVDEIAKEVCKNKESATAFLKSAGIMNEKGELAEQYRQGEQKPADKVEPKFHKGDWVVYCNDDVDLITGIEESGYSINNGGYIPFICENEMRLWDITDAKVGDVLVSESTCGLGTWYCIFKSLDGDESMTVYCYLARDGRFETKKELCFDKDPYNTKPATKEQRNTLFAKMKDAGYTFDFEKKELKRIEEEVNGEDYGIDSLWHAQNILEKTLGSVEGYQSDDGILEHKCAISAVKKLYEQKPWSEEDEKLLALSLNNLTELKDRFGKEYGRTGDCIEWLKSLKDRYTWKPSEKQMQALSNAGNSFRPFE